MLEDEESRTLNSDVIRLLTTSLGFNFSEVIASVQKHRPSRVFATYELLNKKLLKNTTDKPKIVSLRDVKKEMEKSKENQAKKQNQNSESDSGFENKSSSSETEMAKNKPEEKLPLLDDKSNNPQKTKTNIARHNSTTLPATNRGRPVRYVVNFLFHTNIN
jgi:hypothetical protein